MSERNDLKKIKAKYDYTKYFVGVMCPNCLMTTKFDDLPKFNYTAGETVKCPHCEHTFIADNHLE